MGGRWKLIDLTRTDGKSEEPLYAEKGKASNNSYDFLTKFVDQAKLQEDARDWIAKFGEADYYNPQSLYDLQKAFVLEPGEEGVWVDCSDSFDVKDFNKEVIGFVEGLYIEVKAGNGILYRLSDQFVEESGIEDFDFSRAENRT